MARFRKPRHSAFAASGAAIVGRHICKTTASRLENDKGMHPHTPVKIEEDIYRQLTYRDNPSSGQYYTVMMSDVATAG
jgi:hypothetical protein